MSLRTRAERQPLTWPTSAHRDQSVRRQPISVAGAAAARCNRNRPDQGPCCRLYPCHCISHRGGHFAADRPSPPPRRQEMAVRADGHTWWWRSCLTDCSEWLASPCSSCPAIRQSIITRLSPKSKRWNDGLVFCDYSNCRLTLPQVTFNRRLSNDLSPSLPPYQVSHYSHCRVEDGITPHCQEETIVSSPSAVRAQQSGNAN